MDPSENSVQLPRGSVPARWRHVSSCCMTAPVHIWVALLRRRCWITTPRTSDLHGVTSVRSVPSRRREKTLDSSWKHVKAAEMLWYHKEPCAQWVLYGGYPLAGELMWCLLPQCRWGIFERPSLLCPWHTRTDFIWTSFILCSEIM